MEGSSVRLPVELWIQVLTLAAGHPTKDEFADKVESYERFPRDQRTIFPQMTRGEETILLRSRIVLALVCKAWYPIVIKLLWSHLRVILNKALFNAMERVLETLHHNPHIGTLVRHLTIRAETAAFPRRQECHYVNNLMLIKLMKQLPHLKLLIQWLQKVFTCSPPDT